MTPEMIAHISSQPLAQRPGYAASVALVDGGWNRASRLAIAHLAHEAEMACFRESPEARAILTSIEDHARKRRGGGDS